nr:potassium voltage-gated channel subfamily H member 8-like isoform X2 [Ciona intestinalis]|eukprot:XP_026691793.1 potassium voltage-gated channel subfamily H member 8-like isoform X2 [Ciona intestinalis]
METILYKKGGSSFLCLMDIIPIKNNPNGTGMFLVSYKQISTPGDDEDDESAPISFEHLSHRRRSRAVLYNLSESLQTKKKKKCFRRFVDRCFSGYSELKMSGKMSSRFVIPHSSNFKSGWDWFVVFLTLYVTAVVPFYAAIQSFGGANHTLQSPDLFHRKDTNPVSFAIDIVIEILFLLDIGISFRTTFVAKSGAVVLDPKVLALAYIKGWLVVDLIAAVPIDIISHVFNVPWSAQPIALLKIVRLLRLFRLYNKIVRWSHYGMFVLTMLVVLFGLVAHWLACIWFSLGWNEFKSQSGGETDGIGWLYELSHAIHLPFNSNGTGGPDVVTSYITSLYFTLSSLTSVGFGNVSANTNNEKIFSICVMTIGALIHAVIFGNLTATIQRMYVRKSQFDTKMRDLKDLIRVHRLPKSLERRMVEQFQASWGQNGGVNPTEVLKDFSNDIQSDVYVHIHREILDLPMFQKNNQGFTRFLSHHMTRYKVSPGPNIIHQGDPLHDIYFLCNGSIEIRKGDVMVNILGKWDVFGPDVTSQRDTTVTSQFNVRALTHCELECISIKGLLQAEKLYPDLSTGLIETLLSEFSCKLWTREAELTSQVSSGSTENVDLISLLGDRRESKQSKLQDSVIINIDGLKNSPLKGSKDLKRSCFDYGKKKLVSLLSPTTKESNTMDTLNPQSNHGLSCSASEGSSLKQVRFFDKHLTPQDVGYDVTVRKHSEPSISRHITFYDLPKLCAKSNDSTIGKSAESPMTGTTRKLKHQVSLQSRRRRRRRKISKREKNMEDIHSANVQQEREILSKNFASESDSDFGHLPPCDFRTTSRGYSRYHMKSDENYHGEYLFKLRGYASKVSALSRDLQSFIKQIEKNKQSETPLLHHYQDETINFAPNDESFVFCASNQLTSNQVYSDCSKSSDVIVTDLMSQKASNMSLPKYTLTTPNGDTVDLENDVLASSSGQKHKFKSVFLRAESYVDSESGYLSEPHRHAMSS